MTNLLISLLFPLMMAYTPADTTRLNQEPVLDKENCTFNGIPLYGEVRIVEGYADFTVRVVDGHSDLQVRIVESTPIKCGEWRYVEGYADFTVRFVEGYADFTIRFDENAPGIY